MFNIVDYFINYKYLEDKEFEYDEIFMRTRFDSLCFDIICLEKDWVITNPMINSSNS